VRQGTYAEPGSVLRPTAGPERAVDLAARHLTALGCRATGLPDGGLALRAGRHLAECAVDWAGPVELPLADEYDVQAACGLMEVHGRRFGGPIPLGVDFAAATAGVLAALGASAALWACARDGRPRRVRTSVAAAALLAVGQYLAAATADEAGPEEPRLPGGPPFTSADGVRFELESLAAEGWLAFWTGLGVGRTEAGRGWVAFQQRYATATCALPAVLYRAAGCRSLGELTGLAEQAGVDLTPVLAQPPDGAPGLPWRITPTGSATDRSAADRSAADRSSADRSSADRSSADRSGVDRPAPARTAAGPLAGLVVVEVARRVQGPLAAHLLGLLGARVVRIEPPGGDPLRGVPPMAGDCSARFHALNHGKERVEADLGTAAGRSVVRELASGADVFLHSLAPGSDERFGLDAARLTAARPGLVYARASGWGAERGERPPVGTDYPVQAYSGLAALVTPPGRPPTPSLLTLTDVLGGAVCAEGVLGGLLGVLRTGHGRRVDSSLLSAARLLCSPELRSRPRRQGPEAAGPEPAEAAVCTDLARLADDPRFAGALRRDRCVLVRSPWEFG